MIQGPVVRLENLRCELRVDGARHFPVDDVSFEIYPHEVLSLVGESGCGKSLTALSILRLLPSNARVCGGSIWLRDEDIASASDARLRQVRGRKIAMIFQEPQTALNPVLTVGSQIKEALRPHSDGTRISTSRATTCTITETPSIFPKRSGLTDRARRTSVADSFIG